MRLPTSLLDEERAFLLDPAHGWDQTDNPQWSYGVDPQERRDRALRELLGAA